MVDPEAKVRRPRPIELIGRLLRTVADVYLLHRERWLVAGTLLTDAEVGACRLNRWNSAVITPLVCAMFLFEARSRFSLVMLAGCFWSLPFMRALLLGHERRDRIDAGGARRYDFRFLSGFFSYFVDYCREAAFLFKVIGVIATLSGLIHVLDWLGIVDWVE